MPVRTCGAELNGIIHGNARVRRTVVRRALPLLALLWLFQPATHLRAQSDTGTDVPDRFVIDAGGFNMFVSTDLSLNSADIRGTTVNLENDLNLPDIVQRGYVEVFLRLARRHQVSASYGRLDRTGSGMTLSRDINWGGVVYRAGVTAVGHMDTDVLSGAYRFALLKKPRFELGPSVGFGYVWLTAGITATTSTSGPGGTTIVRTVERDANENTPIGDVGGFANWWIARRLYVRTDLRYILIKPDNDEAATTQGRASLTWYPWRHLGFGGQYTYDKFRYTRSVLSTDLGGDYRYSGFQVLASAAF